MSRASSCGSLAISVDCDEVRAVVVEVDSEVGGTRSVALQSDFSEGWGFCLSFELQTSRAGSARGDIASSSLV